MELDGLLDDMEGGQYLTEITPPKTELGQALLDMATDQHPFFAMLVKTLNTRGDEEFLLEFSQDYPKEFFKALMALAPGVGAVQPQQGAVHLHVHASLGPTALDQGQVIDAEVVRD